MKLKNVAFLIALTSSMILCACQQPVSSSSKSSKAPIIIDGGYEDDDSSEPGSSNSSSTDTGDHVHTWDTNWSSDENYHWHKCTGTISSGSQGGWGGWGGGTTACTEVKDKAAHTWDNGTITKEAGKYSKGIKVYKCSVCLREKQETIPATGGGTITSGFDFDDTQLNYPQEIHTADQKNFLSFSGEYYHITASDLSGFNANGNSNVSAPLPVVVNWGYGIPSGKTVKNYTFTFGQKADLSDGYSITVSSTEAQFYNAFLGTNYFKITANLSDNSTEESAIKTFKVTEQAPRNLKVGNMPNVRDTGGRTTYAGGKIKQGLIYRGAGNKFDNSSQVDNECKNTLLQQLKIKTEINVANSTTNNINLTGVTVKNAYMDYGSTPYSNLSRNAERVRQVMDILADETNYPVFYHCRIGTDRTGITGMMIGGLLGIPFNEIFQDYCFSNFSPIDGQRYPNKPSDPNGDDPAKYIDEILAMPGKNYQEKTYNALLSIGVPAAKLNTIIDIMTEGPKATLPTPNVGKGNDLTSTGTKKNGSDYKDPDVYYTITNGQAVNYQATFTAGQKDIIVYLGSSDSSDSTKLAAGISLKIDGTEVTITNDKTYFKAGFGTTQQNSRTGYMVNILAQYNLSAGSHTITITGKNSTSFNIGSVGVFDHVTA